MSRSDWLKTVTFVVVLLATFSVGWRLGNQKWEEYAADRQELYSELDEYLEARIRICSEPEGIIVWFSCLYEAVQPGEKDRTAQKDLKVQQHMSIWAFGVLVVSFATWIVTVWGVFFVWQTLKKADETHKAAMDAVEAANEANRIMREEQRGWLSFDYLPAEARFPDSRIFIPIRFNAKNVGNKPIFEPRLHFEFYDLVGKGPEEQSAFKREMIEKARKGISLNEVIFPDEPGTGFIPELEINRQSQGTQIWMVCSAVYRIAPGGSEKATVQSLFIFVKPADGETFENVGSPTEISVVARREGFGLVV